MLIHHDNHASSLSHDGVDYRADEHGRIEVPEHVGRTLTRFPHWHVYTGDPEPTEEEQAAAEKAELLARVAELENQLAASNRRRAAKTPAGE